MTEEWAFLMTDEINRNDKKFLKMTGGRINHNNRKVETFAVTKRKSCCQ
jgi:hypothetical protein